MPQLSDAQVVAYLRQLRLPDVSEPTSVRAIPADGSEQRFRIAAGGATYTLTCYDPAALDSARREAAGLRLGGQMGMAPALVHADESSGALGGPVVLSADPVGEALGGGRLSADDVHGWLFLLLTLHHLPADSTTVATAGSPDAATWWQRTQPAWSACQAAYQQPAFQPLIQALAKLHAVVGVHVEAHRGLWQSLRRRPCHGNPVPAHVVRTGKGMMFVEWNGFGLGDPAMELGRAAALAALAGELSASQYVQFVSDYLAGMRDVRDATLEERVRVFASILPLGFSFAVLQLLAQSGPGSADYRHNIEQVERALIWIQDTLGVEVGKPADLLAPLRVGV